MLEAARKAKAPVIGLAPDPNAIRAVARSGGVAKLDPTMRKKLPAEMELHDPPYEKLLAAQMMVHMAASPQRLRPMIEAQIARDEAMSARWLTTCSRQKEAGGRRLSFAARATSCTAWARRSGSAGAEE